MTPQSLGWVRWLTWWLSVHDITPNRPPPSGPGKCTALRAGRFRKWFSHADKQWLPYILAELSIVITLYSIERTHYIIGWQRQRPAVWEWVQLPTQSPWDFALVPMCTWVNISLSSFSHNIVPNMHRAAELAYKYCLMRFNLTVYIKYYITGCSPLSQSDWLTLDGTDKLLFNANPIKIIIINKSHLSLDSRTGLITEF